jgi:hypothetical protein
VFSSEKGINLGYSHTTRSRNLAIIDVLTGSPYWNKSVWDLKRYVKNKGSINGPDDALTGILPSVYADYGFYKCKDWHEHRRLFNLYQEFFANTRSNERPLGLHQVCVQGRLFEYFTMDLNHKFKKSKGMYKRILSNPYPLPPCSLSHVAGITINGDVVLHITGDRNRLSNLSYLWKPALGFAVIGLAIYFKAKG